MKRNRILTAFLIGVLLSVLAGSALAANKTAVKEAKTKPTVKISAPNSLESGQYDEIKVNASMPGFIDLTLNDASGRIVLTIAENGEIHSTDNSFSLTAYDDNGDPIPEGTYNITATMRSQYGVSSDTAQKKINITEPEEEEEEATTSKSSSSSSSKSSSSKSSSSSSSKSSTSKSSSSSSSKSSSSKSSSASTTAEDTSDDETTSTASSSSSSSSRSSSPAQEVSYRNSSIFSLGDEGYQIGVGVNDVYEQTTPNYWTLDASASEEEIWAAIIQPMTSVNVDEKESAYIYDSVKEGRSKLGTISGLSQGVNVLVTRDDGWSLVEAFRNEDGAFVRGYMRTNRLKVVDVSPYYGIVIDKATQKLTVYMNGEAIGSCLVCTGLPTVEHLQRETPAGEFITVTRRGTVEYLNRGYSKFAIRINGNVYLQDIPSTKKGGSDFSLLEDYLGSKATRGTICIQHKASSDGGINAEWIWDMTDVNKKVKVLIFDDKPRDSVPVGN